MKKILVPTDFSERAKDAYMYARALAEEFNASIKVVHAYHPTAEVINSEDVNQIPNLEDIKKDAMINFVSHGFSNTIVDVIIAEQIEHEIIIGFPIEKIIELSKDYDLIVMGTTGKGGHLLEKLMGSISSKVAQFAHCPVMLIPEGKEYRGVNNIAFAGSYDSTDEKALKTMTEYARLFEANVHVVHIYEKQEMILSDLVLQKLFEKKAPGLSFKMISITNKSVEKGLRKYALENDIDLLVNVTKERKFWDNLLHKSVTKKLVLNAKVPLLVLHV